MTIPHLFLEPFKRIFNVLPVSNKHLFGLHSLSSAGDPSGCQTPRVRASLLGRMRLVGSATLERGSGNGGGDPIIINAAFNFPCPTSIFCSLAPQLDK